MRCGIYKIVLKILKKIWRKRRRASNVLPKTPEKRAEILQAMIQTLNTNCTPGTGNHSPETRSPVSADEIISQAAVGHNIITNSVLQIKIVRLEIMILWLQRTPYQPLDLK